MSETNSMVDLKKALDASRSEACPICGHSGLIQQNVLWPTLIAEWGLSGQEVALIDRQQGEQCKHCRCNLRSRTLAGALCECLNWQGSLELLIASADMDQNSVLEINEAGQIHRYLERWPNYTFANYPEVDMQAMPYDEGQFDFIIHSDTLEHVPNPVRALSECKRVLRTNGCLVMTIPIVPTRLTRRRDELAPSYHGQADAEAGDMKVITEYGADFYIDFINAGWKKISLFTLGSLASIAVIGIK